MRFHVPCAAALLATTLLAEAGAFEAGPVGETPVTVDVTNASSVAVNVDNRNTRAGAAETRTDDDWAYWYNRLNVQATWKDFEAGFRLDSAWFLTRPSPAGVGLDMLRDRNGILAPPFVAADADFFVQKTLEAGDDLSSRYINWVYPAKVYVGYTSPHVEVTVGDFYAELGRGLVLSVRKLDELSSDTTVRGGRVTGRVRAGDVRLKLTGLGGTMNPLRLDEASGRYLSVDGSVTEGFDKLTEVGMPRTIDTFFDPSPSPSYAPDHLFGAQLEGSLKKVKLAVQGSLLDRQPAVNQDIVRTADTMLTGSVSASFPDLFGHGAAYVEVAGQQLQHSQTPEVDLGGHAVYGSLALFAKPLSLTTELKHYRSFFPLAANVDLSQAPEFAVVQYSSPPTTEAFWVDTEFGDFNTCTTGGRSKLDVELGDDESVFAWVGRYDTWAESASNETCRTSDDDLNRVWDFAVGTEITSQERQSRAEAVVGSRIDETDRRISDGRGLETHVFYEEVYVRYDVIRALGGPFSLQLQGWHRRRRQTLGGPNETYTQAQHVTGFGWDKLTMSFGVELDTDPATPRRYFNGQAKYNITSGSNVALFVGQRRGGLRCVSGVCRIFPPFEGGRLDLTIRL